MICSILANLAIVAGTIIPAQPPSSFVPSVDFFKEEITMTVGDGRAGIEGIYYFRNNTDNNKPFPVLFPFYIDKNSHFPYEIIAYCIDNADTVNINFEPLTERGMIRLAIPMKPNEITIWHLEYSQKIDVSRARYILTSTSAWHKPLEEATYRFVVPKSFDVNYAWPEADSVLAGDKVTLLSHKINFMPQQDMEIIWERK